MPVSLSVRSKWLAILATATALATAGGCPQTTVPNGNGNDNSDGGDKNPTATGKLITFGSSDELLSYFRDRAMQGAQRTPGRLDFFFDMFSPATAGGVATAAAESDNASGGSDDRSFSTTNTQEADVDESDIVKSDGTNFFIARGQQLMVVQAFPRGEMRLIGQLDLDDVSSEMYLFGSKILLLANEYGGVAPYWGFAEIAMWPPYYYNSKTKVHQIDVSDPANPVLEKSIELEGTIVSTRLTNGRLLLVLTIVPNLPPYYTADDVEKMEIDDLLPKATTSAGETVMVDWTSWYRPDPENGFYTTAVVSLDAADVEKIVSSTAVMASAGTVYSSSDALYVADTDYSMNGTAREKTLIHKFAFDDNGAANYVASGEVPGRLLNQFSLGEHEGNLRVATHVAAFVPWVFENPPRIDFARSGDDVTISVTVDTSAPPTPPEPTNAVYVLGESEGDLVVKGAIENIAPSERIYSARFLGDKGFLVTFRQIDPLFTIDLSDPANPAIKGELKIPGFNDYLHPWGENLLIGVGKSTTTSPWGGVITDRVQLSLFDVSDLANPRVVEQIEVGGRYSSAYAGNDHKAFAFLGDRGLLALPGYYTQDQGAGDDFDYWYDAENEVAVFQLDSTGFTELGRLGYAGPSGGYSWYGIPQPRAAFIEDTVYSIGWWGVKAADLSDFNSTSEVVLPFEYPTGSDPVLMNMGVGMGGSGGVGEATAPGR